MSIEENLKEGEDFDFDFELNSLIDLGNKEGSELRKKEEFLDFIREPISLEPVFQSIALLKSMDAQLVSIEAEQREFIDRVKHLLKLKLIEKGIDTREKLEEFLRETTKAPVSEIRHFVNQEKSNIAFLEEEIKKFDLKSQNKKKEEFQENLDAFNEYYSREQSYSSYVSEIESILLGFVIQESGDKELSDAKKAGYLRKLFSKKTSKMAKAIERLEANMKKVPGFHSCDDFIVTSEIRESCSQYKEKLERIESMILSEEANIEAINLSVMEHEKLKEKLKKVKESDFDISYNGFLMSLAMNIGLKDFIEYNLSSFEIADKFTISAIQLDMIASIRSNIKFAIRDLDKLSKVNLVRGHVDLHFYPEYKKYGLMEDCRYGDPKYDEILPWYQRAYRAFESARDMLKVGGYRYRGAGHNAKMFAVDIAAENGKIEKPWHYLCRKQIADGRTMVSIFKIDADIQYEIGTQSERNRLSGYTRRVQLSYTRQEESPGITDIIYFADRFDKELSSHIKKEEKGC